MLSTAFFPTREAGVVSVAKVLQVICDQDNAQDGCSTRLSGLPGSDFEQPRLRFVDTTSSSGLYRWPFSLSSQSLVLDPEAIMKAHKFVPLRPHSLIDSLTCSGLAPERFYFWWRAVAAAFMIRPNAVSPISFTDE